MTWKENFQNNGKTKLLPFWKEKISHGNDKKNSKMLINFPALCVSAIKLICTSYREKKNIKEPLSESSHG